jgi:IPT/TIG domain
MVVGRNGQRLMSPRSRFAAAGLLGLVLAAALVGLQFHPTGSLPDVGVGVEQDQLTPSLTSSTGACGVERWSVKTGTDADATLVNLGATTPTTIATMRSYSRPASLPANNRIQPQETTVYSIDATLTEYKLETDSDYHLVIQDGSGSTMITEIPDPVCAAGSLFLTSIQSARGQFDAKFTATGSFKITSVPVRVRGIGFFDFLHGQTGVAPNGIELHPVLDIQFNPLPSVPTVDSVVPNSGPPGGGTSVTITGTNFTGATAVKFGAAATFAVNSSTQITATSPPGFGTVDITVTNTGGTSATSAADQFTFLPGSPAVAVLPAVSNGAYGGYVTAATIQNTGSAPATVRIAYFDQNGAPVGAGDSISSLPVNASWTVRQDNGNSFPSSGGDAAQAGSAVVYSNQPIASFVNEFAPGNAGDATSYSGVTVPSGVGTTLYAPTIVNNAYGGYTTGIGLLNEGSSPTAVAITYRDGSGVVVKVQPVGTLAAHAYQALYSGDALLALPAGFAGTATIASSAGQPLGAVVNETGPGGQFSSYDAVPAGSTTLNVPVALNNAFGGYYTGMGIQNTSASVGIVTVTYYDALGTATAKVFSIAANGSLGVYQRSATDGPAVGAYTATITSSVAIAGIVNEVAPSSTNAMQSTSYNTFSAGSASLNLPLVENAGSDPWNTGEGIMNTGTAATAVQVTYYDTSSGAAIGTPQTQIVGPHAFWGLYQPTGGLPSGSRATAVVSTSSGGQVAVICNESSASTFMSYDSQ